MLSKTQKAAAATHTWGKLQVMQRCSAQCGAIKTSVQGVCVCAYAKCNTAAVFSAADLRWMNEFSCLPCICGVDMWVSGRNSLRRSRQGGEASEREKEEERQTERN
mmetsp:Transcript_30620/g.60223  ORF Transcript_30620/g.60223 Transcript_30620/m.60223 type:complete len:106 (-) Transcript_30620:3172-3489(-)